MQKQRFDELLPFYANGTLAEAERAEVEAWLREHPKSAAELRWYESLQQKLHDDVPAVSSEVGLERALHRIRTEGPRPAATRRAAQPSWFARAAEWLGTLVPQPVLKPALAAALAVVVVQAGVIGHFASEDDTSQLRAVPGAAVAEQGPYLKVNFKPDAREADIRLLLVQSGASLAAGPGQLGDYYLRVPAERFAAAQTSVAGSPLVDGVSVVDGLPAR